MTKKRVTSRLAKKKKKQFTKQSVVLIMLSVIVGAVFIFVVLPNAVRLFFDLLDKETNIGPVDNIPPQPPLISAPPEATSSSKIKLDGFGEAQADLFLVVNNQEQDKVTINDDGQFELTAELSAGDNTVKLYSVDAAGNESLTKTYQIIQDSQDPEIKIGFPEDEASFNKKEDQVINIQGETEPGAKVYVNGSLTYSNSEGLFNYRYRLEDGENKIEIKAVDLAGNEAQVELTVRYRD